MYCRSLEKLQVRTIQFEGESNEQCASSQTVKGKGELFVLSPDNLAYLTGLKSQFHKYLQVNYSRLRGGYKCKNVNSCKLM